MQYGHKKTPAIYNLTIEADTGENGEGNKIEWSTPVASLLIALIDGPTVYLHINDSEQGFPMTEGDTLSFNADDVHITKIGFRCVTSAGDDAAVSVIAGEQ